METTFTPREIVSELDRYIVGQNDAKRAVAIALRNRWRRQQVPGELRDEIAPKNIIMIGPTGVGKTEIARRLSKLANAPFIKVEASKFTEVGYVGKDVESMIRELLDTAINMVRSEEEEKVKVKAEELAEERLLDLLLPKKPQRSKQAAPLSQEGGIVFDGPIQEPPPALVEDEKDDSREKMKLMLRTGKLDNRSVELQPDAGPRSGGMPMIEVVTAGGSLEDIGKNLREMFSGMMPAGRKRKKVKVPEALKILTTEEAAKLIEMDEV